MFRTDRSIIRRSNAFIAQAASGNVISVSSWKRNKAKFHERVGVRVQGRVLSSHPFPEYRADVRDVQVGVEGFIADIPWGTGYSSEKSGLISLDDSYVGLSSTSP
jgi:hypothetical protein